MRSWRVHRNKPPWKSLPVNEPLVINDQIRIPASELQFSFSRSSGPGGQNVNKVNSKATLRWALYQSQALPHAVLSRFATRFAGRINDAGEIVIQSDTHRDQPRNVTDCLERLRAMVLSVARPPAVRKKTKPSRAANQRRLDRKREQSVKKQNRQTGDWE